jgi:hypothetical protein
MDEHHLGVLDASIQRQGEVAYRSGAGSRLPTVLQRWYASRDCAPHVPMTQRSHSPRGGLVKRFPGRRIMLQNHGSGIDLKRNRQEPQHDPRALREPCCGDAASGADETIAFSLMS